MDNVSHQKSWRTGIVKIHAKPALTPLIKSNLDLKIERYNLKIELRGNPTSEKLDVYEFKMVLFENVEA